MTASSTATHTSPENASAARRSRNGGHASVGTLAWARKKEGRLSRREQVREFAAAMRVLMGTAPSQARYRLGLRSAAALDLDPDSIPIPDSTIAREAEELCAEASRESGKENLTTHCFRTYLWGMLLGRHDRLQPDAEVLFVASMLHDLALTDRFRDYHPMPCFAARAAIHATDWAGSRGWGEDRCAVLGDAVSMHVNSSVGVDQGAEVHLVQAGAGLDVIGARIWELSPSTVEAVLRKYPRLGFKDEYGMFRAEAHPRTRAQLLDRWLKLGVLARIAPFDD
jgi:hypothetical protein